MKGFEFIQKSAVEQPINTLKAEHLKSGFKPIIACLEGPEQLRDDTYGCSFSSIVKENIFAREVDYQFPPEDFENGGNKTFVFSPTDSKDKVSEWFFDCTGLVIAGYDEKQGRDISFMSHQDPDFLGKDKNKRDIFFNILRKKLEEMKRRSAEGSLDAIIIGGNYVGEADKNKLKEKLNNLIARRIYHASIKSLAQEVSAILGFEPVVIAGPKKVRKSNSFYYANAGRRLYTLQPKIDSAICEPYLPRDLKEQTKKWK